jgi:ADP-dependent NAD(P)H-hydrate dehydratase
MIQPVEITPVSLGLTPLPQPRGDTDKTSRGQLLVVGGSVEVAGAALLAGLAALRSGAGKLRFAAPEAYAVALALQAPEARVIAMPASESGEICVCALERLKPSLETMDAVVIGPGALDEQAAAALAEAMMRAGPAPAFLIDAAAMTGLRLAQGLAELCAGRAVLTPHAGEMAKLMDLAVEEVRQDPAGVALQAARRFNATVVLKGRQTHVAEPGGQVWRNSAGVSGLGVCGSGDVLSGVIGGLLARGAPPPVAAIWGVYAHAQSGARLAGRIAPFGFLAREIADGVPAELAAAAG